MQFDKIYLFNVEYLDKNGKEKNYKTYADNNNVYSLENLPDTAYLIEVYLLKKDFDGSIFGEEVVAEYLIGTPLKAKDLREEIATAIDTGADPKYLEDLKEWDCDIANSEDPYVIFRIQGKILCLNGLMYPGKVIGVIEDGKIVKQKSQTAQTQQPAKREYDNYNYTDLE